MGRSNDRGGKGGGRGRGGRGGGRGGHHKSKSTSHHHHSSSSSSHHRHKKVEITFNRENRHEYLTGFASRKKERRAFGLAMQKMKDRQSKLEENKEKREAQLEKIEDIERNKATLRRGLAGDNGDEEDDGDNSASDNDNDDDNKKEAQHTEQETFQDEHTTHQFGALVSVTTTFGIPSDDDDDDDDINAKGEFYARAKHGSNHIDEEQKRASNVNSYITAVKGTMGSKKKGSGNKHKKGQHGAQSMKGMGSGTTLKHSKKILSKFKAKGGGKGGHEEGVRGGKGKKGRKGRR